MMFPRFFGKKTPGETGERHSCTANSQPLTAASRVDSHREEFSSLVESMLTVFRNSALPMFVVFVVEVGWWCLCRFFKGFVFMLCF